MSTVTVGTAERFTEYGATVETWEPVDVLTVRAGDIVKHGAAHEYVYGARDNGTHVVLSVSSGYLQGEHGATVLRMVR